LEVLALLEDNTQTGQTIASHQSVEDAICLMAGDDISALVVTENGRPAGLFCKSDVCRIYLRMKSSAFSEIALKDAMTRNLVVAEPQDTITEVIARMIQVNTAYLPVIQNKEIVGMLTLVDLMKHQIEALADEIYQLNEYISDLHDAGQY
jgi:CBS domain-containing protein